jgi:hypothetical protein
MQSKVCGIVTRACVGRGFGKPQEEFEGLDNPFFPRQKNSIPWQRFLHLCWKPIKPL